MTRERVLMCWSGGKDSAMALYELQRTGRYDVAALLTTVTEAYDRISMHGVRRALLREQAEVLGLPLHEIFLTPGAPNTEYESKMREALLQFKAQGVTGVVFGDIFLEDLKIWREQKLAEVDLCGIFPIWQRDTRELVQSVIRVGIKTVLCCVDPKQLDPSFVGRVIDEQFVRDLPAGVDPCGENGEFHSFVYDAPNFARPIPWTRGEVVLRDGFYFCDLLPADLVTS